MEFVTVRRVSIDDIPGRHTEAEVNRASLDLEVFYEGYLLKRFNGFNRSFNYGRV